MPFGNTHLSRLKTIQPSINELMDTGFRVQSILPRRREAGATHTLKNKNVYQNVLTETQWLYFIYAQRSWTIYRKLRSVPLYTTTDTISQSFSRERTKYILLSVWRRTYPTKRVVEKLASKRKRAGTNIRITVNHLYMGTSHRSSWGSN